MPRQVRIRQTPTAEPDASTAVRRQWVTTWKRWAIAQLPSTTPRAVRVELRGRVERSLLHFGPGDDEEEVREIALGVVEDSLARLQAETDRTTREENKRTAVAEAEFFLRLGLVKFPRDQVAAMLKQPGYSIKALTQGLKRHFEKHVRGNEKIEEILERVVAWVERRLAEQPKPSRRWPGLVAKVGGATAALTAMALKDPEVREATIKGLARAREKAREVLARWIPPSDRSAQP